MIKSRMITWAGYVARRASRGFCGEERKKKSLENPRCKWEDNIITDLKRNILEICDQIYVASDTDQWQVCVSRTLNLRIPLKYRNF